MVNQLYDKDINSPEAHKMVINREDCSKEKLKVLNEKEKELKEKIFKVIIDSKATDKEAIRVLAFLINAMKRIKKRGEGENGKRRNS